MPRAKHYKKALARVRCLGPGAEHTFASPDPVRVRVCKACRQKLDARGQSSYDEPARVAPEASRCPGP